MKMFVTGGSASGKSEYAGRAAEKLAAGRPILYIATLSDRSPESEARVARHDALRRAGNAVYVVKECFSLGDLAELEDLIKRGKLSGHDEPGGSGESGGPALTDGVSAASCGAGGFGAIFLDSIDALTADIMFGTAPDFRQPAGFEPESYAELTAAAVLGILDSAENAVAVIDDIFRGGGKYGASTREYIRYTALTGRKIAAGCGLAAEVISGVPVILKGGEDEFPEIDSYHAVALH
ncbi:MAG: bifunctional adenosylcobinamide kinase/adenosylcobinamide-phosphate guanylyltransferase [Anaerovoracaceae bacterium]|jgi:adenosyl cobinamide kinase/adenosyl cobinamide phosphate guanylyltransferase